MEHPTFSHDQEKPIPPVSKIFTAQALSFISLIIARSCGKRACDQHKSRGADNVWQTRTAAPPPDIMKPAATPPEGAALRHFAGGGNTPAPPAFFLFPQPRPRRSSALPLPAPSTPGASTLPLATALSPPAYHHQRAPVWRTSVIIFSSDLQWMACACWQKRAQLSSSFVNLLSSAFASSTLS